MASLASVADARICPMGLSAQSPGDLTRTLDFVTSRARAAVL
jgi:hypothetical protein